MWHCAVGIETGDGAETRADEVWLTGTRRADLFIDRDFGNAFLSECFIQPAEKFTQGGAILFHCFTDKLGFASSFTGFEKHGRIDCFNDFGAGRNRRAQAKRDTARIDQHAAVCWQCRQCSDGVVVSGDLYAVGCQFSGNRARYFAFGDKQCALFRIQQQVRNEYRVVADIAAAQIEQPCNIVHRRNQVMLCAEFLHAATDLRQLFRTTDYRERCHVAVNRCSRQTGAVVPDQAGHIGIGFQDKAGLRRLTFQHAGSCQAEHHAIHTQHLTCSQMLCQPFDIAGGGSGIGFHHRDAGTSQFGFGLTPVAAVHPQTGKVCGNDQGADGTGEAGKIFTALPAFRQVFG